MAVKTQKVEIYGKENGRWVKKREFDPGETAKVKIQVWNKNWFPVINYETRVWLGSSCRNLSIKKKCYIPFINIRGVGWCVQNIKVPDSPGKYGIGGNGKDEGQVVRHCHTINIYRPPPPKKAKLVVRTDPSEATIYIDGEKVGKSPVKKVVEAGMHKIVAKKKGYKKAVVNKGVKKGETKEVKLKLEPVKPEKKNWMKALLAGIAGVGVGMVGGYLKERSRYGESAV